MTRRQRTIAVETRADLILADYAGVKDYAAHFETQMHRGRVRGLLVTAYPWFVRARKILTRLTRLTGLGRLARLATRATHGCSS
jgi:hypothetical protein